MEQTAWYKPCWVRALFKQKLCDSLIRFEMQNMTRIDMISFLAHEYNNMKCWTAIVFTNFWNNSWHLRVYEFSVCFSLSSRIQAQQTYIIDMTIGAEYSLTHNFIGSLSFQDCPVLILPTKIYILQHLISHYYILKPILVFYFILVLILSTTAFLASRLLGVWTISSFLL